MIKKITFLLILLSSFAVSATGTIFSPYIDITGSITGSQNGITSWDSSTQSLQPVGLANIVTNSKVSSLTLAFLAPPTSNPQSCAASWGGAYPVPLDGPNYGPTDFAVAAISKLESVNDLNIIISFGGSSTYYIEQNCQSVSALAQVYEGVIAAYHPNTLDFSNEELQGNTQVIDQQMQALAQVLHNHVNLTFSFTLPASPQGLDANGITYVTEALKYLPQTAFSINLLTYGAVIDPTVTTMSDYAIQAATATRAQLNRIQANSVNIGIVPMNGLDVVYSTSMIIEDFTLVDAVTVGQFAKTHSGINVISMWSMNRDAPCNNSQVKANCSSANATGQPNQQNNFDYSTAFMNNI